MFSALLSPSLFLVRVGGTNGFEAMDHLRGDNGVATSFLKKFGRIFALHRARPVGVG